MVKKYTSMAYAKADDMLFGNAKFPVKAGLGLEIGAGFTTPEINYAPRPQAGKSKDKLIKEYERITTDVMARMVQIGAPSIVLETEHVEQMSNNPEWGGAVAHAQKTIMEEYHDEYGIKCALRHTIGDIREDRDYLQLRGDKYSVFLEAFEECAKNGADLLSVESMGGKEVFDYSILRNDTAGILFGIGVLGSMDMEMIWTDIAKITKKTGTVAAGDTDCAQANTAMFIAGGLLDKNLAHTTAIVARAISAGRTLCGFEAGATGPGKDCGYENTIIKSISGVPIAQEGKSSTCAHSDLMGNVTMQCCDLWSNESVEYHGEFGGTTVQCWSESLAYDCAMMNTSLKLGKGKDLRDILALSDKYRDPQGYVVSYENAYKVGQAIAKDGNNNYLRAKNAAIESCNIVEEGINSGKLRLTRFETNALAKVKADLVALTDDADKFMSESLTKYKQEVGVFRLENYGL
ncbi:MULTISPECIES: methanol--corrinoid protein co-methyltransferase MtaB [unclassified Methanosarcina]|uniref:methanol--corrinoid protein co-methyltransferase MtaB n=1 Tax=unclassified Methanosarcina TaxID=2644672 RepID=UPI000615A4AA|nr:MULTISPECIES: methanol--corrinoid protein co-methyltransferase MtaB [unclassified Methanosarcina]AKB17401.1 Methanol:corrinoid methyltransferase [Methanosarcina sp. WWM596]AKB20795.1 Methanol:corrinoid methyltransferase [Methanosarcina sp. WH1]